MVSQGGCRELLGDNPWAPILLAGLLGTIHPRPCTRLWWHGHEQADVIPAPPNLDPGGQLLLRPNQGGMAHQQLMIADREGPFHSQNSHGVSLLLHLSPSLPPCQTSLSSTLFHFNPLDLPCRENRSLNQTSQSLTGKGNSSPGSVHFPHLLPQGRTCVCSPDPHS